MKKRSPRSLALFAALWLFLGGISQFVMKASLEGTLFYYGVALVFAIIAIGTWYGSTGKTDA